MKVQLRGLAKEFVTKGRRVKAVCGIDMEIKEKEFFVLLGPSGCGKSTLLNLIAGLEKPSAGEIIFNDQPVVAPAKRIYLPPKERNVAMVFQSYALYPHMNIFDNIAFPLKMEHEKKERIHEAVQRTAKILKIEELLTAKPKELSGGQRQRVAIARAIVRRPNLFLLDEPLSNLDAQLRASMRAELKEIQRELGITTIYVTHDQVEAMTLGDRIAVLRNGQQVQVGRPNELYEHPAVAFVGAFIGSPAMNLVEGTIKKQNGRHVLAFLGQKREFLDEAVAKWRQREPGPCLVGIRPEHICMPAQNSDFIFRGKITSVETLGREKLLRCRVENQELLFLHNGPEVQEGSVVTIGFPAQKLHVFKKS